jgi:hypothetical protein
VEKDFYETHRRNILQIKAALRRKEHDAATALQKGWDIAELGVSI